MDARSIKAVTYLSKQPILHMDMIHLISRGTAEIMAVSAEGVLLYDTSSHAYFITADTKKTAIEMAEKISHFPIVSHQKNDLEVIEQRRDYQEKLSCYQAVYLTKKQLNIPQQGLDILPLRKQDLPLIFLYGQHVDATYLTSRYRHGELWGAYKEETLVGFIGIHEEGSIGMLHVFDAYQRRGVASLLEGYLTDEYVKQGLVPFAQIEVGNEASLKLHQKLGYTVSEGYLTWFF